MDHSHMDHGGMSHGDMDMGNNQCSMNMIFTWDYNNLCVVFRSWRITSVPTLLVSLLAIVVLTAGYEAVREASRQYEERTAARKSALPSKLSCSLPVPFPSKTLRVHCPSFLPLFFSISSAIPLVCPAVLDPSQSRTRAKMVCVCYEKSTAKRAHCCGQGKARWRSTSRRRSSRRRFMRCRSFTPSSSCESSIPPPDLEMSSLWTVQLTLHTQATVYDV